MVTPIRAGNMLLLSVSLKRLRRGTDKVADKYRDLIVLAPTQIPFVTLTTRHPELALHIHIILVFKNVVSPRSYCYPRSRCRRCQLRQRPLRRVCYCLQGNGLPIVQQGDVLPSHLRRKLLCLPCKLSNTYCITCPYLILTLSLVRLSPARRQRLQKC